MQFPLFLTKEEIEELYEAVDGYVSPNTIDKLLLLIKQIESDERKEKRKGSTPSEYYRRQFDAKKDTS